MKASKLSRLMIGVAFAVGTLAAVGPVVAAAPGHDAEHPAKLTLDHGRKWATDAPLRSGMDRIRALVAPQLDAAHAGKLSRAQYKALAGKIETEVAGIVTTCKLEPDADAVLHVIIGEIGAGTDAMVGKSAGQKPAQGLVQVANAVNDYVGHFDHPGFQPIPNAQ